MKTFIELVRERETKNFTVYSIAPDGVVLKDVVYLSTEWLREQCDGDAPEKLRLIFEDQGAST
jgi:hypothetical protein